MNRTLRLLLALTCLATPTVSAQTPTKMTAHFIDVGQAHATLLEFPCGAMLVDAGSDGDHDNSLVDYLTSFFSRRSDLHNTLEVVLITHNHIDHTRSLKDVANTFTIKRYFDNGFTAGSGVANPNWLKREIAAGHFSTVEREIDEPTVLAVPAHAGLTDSDIDPFNCGTVDPKVHILAGRTLDNTDWTDDDFSNQNNHSLVTRIDFGKASFLFMGDMEEAGIETLLSVYSDTTRGLLDTDVLQVSHHGSHNGTTSGLVHAVTPQVAVIPVGPWTFGQPGTPFTTFAYGHPRQVAVKLLTDAMTRLRSPSRTVHLGERSKVFHNVKVTKAVYATGWDGTVRVDATSLGKFTVYREH